MNCRKTEKKLPALLLLMLLTLLACSNDSPEENTPGPNGTDEEKTERYWNPVIRENLPDPTVIRDESTGYFYLYGTEGGFKTESGSYYMPVYRSKDMLRWEIAGRVFASDNDRGDAKGRGIWAPDIQYIKGKWVLFLTINKGDHKTNSVAYAVADKPEGPFEYKHELFTGVDTGVLQSIDQFYWEENGRSYIFFGSFRGIFYYELNITDDLEITLKGNDPKADKKQIAGDAFEGSNIWKRGDYYYYFGSAGNFTTSEYCTVVARSKSLFGPYLDKDGADIMNVDKISSDYSSIILRKSNDNTFTGPGHNAKLVEDDEGNTWMFYHAYHNGGSTREVCLDKVEWTDDGWPVINDGTPSAQAKAPVIK